MSELTKRFSIQSYIDKNRDKIDESLVSLRFMKQVDEFLDYKNFSNKDLATKLGYSESYVSQLMSGVKKVNTSFINKFEKLYDAKIEFRVYLNTEKSFVSSLKENNFCQINFNLNMNRIVIHNETSSFFFIKNSTEMSQIEDIEYENL